MIDLSTLDFGAPAAERDVSKGLYEYFVESEEYRRVATGAKTLVLGNRGTGKSAIFKVAAERNRKTNAVVIELRPEDYAYEMLHATLRREADGKWAKTAAFAAAWKYLLLLLTLRRLNDSGFKLKVGGEAKIHSYLRDNIKGEQASAIALLVSYIKRIEGVKIGTYEAGIRTRDLDGLYKLEELQPLMPALCGLLDRKPVAIFVDELDQGWDSSDDARAFVAGLVQAANALNQLHHNLRVFVSLRQELYDNIPALYEDAQKYRDVIEVIRWDEDRLKSLIANRVRHTVPALKHMDDQQCWESVFVPVLQYRQSKSFNYVVDRTLFRPREMIQFCTEALEVARQQNGLPIDYTVLNVAEIRYSGDRAKDIAAEYRFQYPGLLSVFETLRGRAFAMDRDELEYTCLQLVEGEIQVDAEAHRWISNQDPEYLIEVLWRIGFLRAQAVGGIKALQRSGSTYLGSYQVEHLNLRNLTRFHVHPMFRSYLGMKEAKGTH